jgi:23S rRNA (adenine2503-C2)-methyltransferase
MMNAMEDARTDLKGMPLPELTGFFRSRGKERYRARQVSRWLYRKFAEEFSMMTDLSRDFRDEMETMCRISSPPAEKEELSLDGTEKVLFRLEDGEGIESVLIPEESRRTLCVSTQAGCALSCVFCATGASGFRRNMTSAEIIHQACFAGRKLAERGERLTNVVFMGMGEPLENVPEVSRAIDILLSQYGFGMAGKRVTVSTAGIIPAMRDLADRYPVSFAVSLNAASEEVRSRLMPVNRRYPLRDLIPAMRGIPLRSGRKVTAEYVLLSGVNDAPAEARALARLLSGSRIKVNLISVNPHDQGDFRPPSPASVERFRDILMAGGVQTITRERRGADIRAACGQLRGAPAVPRERGKSLLRATGSSKNP